MVRTVFAKAPASIPVGSITINEIYNGSDLQWVELHNSGTAEVNVKNYELEAAHGDKKLQRVFVIPKDAKIPAGGFLVIASVDPEGNGTPHRLLAGDDLYDGNEFNKGATHLYITIPMTGDNKWMPEKDFLLVLRNGNDKDNHEKIVDIAGNKFIDGEGDPETAVWPLQAWAKPGDMDAADWGGADNSLGRNNGMTYARVQDKNNANRLHKENWRNGRPDGRSRL